MSVLQSLLASNIDCNKYSRCPSLQYMDDVDPGGVADMSGVNTGDFLHY